MPCRVCAYTRPQPVVARRKYALLAGDLDHVPSEQRPEGEASGHTPAGSQPGTASLTAPLWQLAAPKADLYISKDDAATGEAGKEPYPKKFEEIIEFLHSGKEIPGIQKIPDTVISDPVSSQHPLLVQSLARHGPRPREADKHKSISTTSGRPVPLKPWEKRTAAAAPGSTE